MKKDFPENIIFDLGGVIINLEPQRTIVELAKISTFSEEEMLNFYLNAEPFKQYEMGLISDESFREFLKNDLSCNAEDALLDKAWNAMLLDIPRERLELLVRLRENHKLFLLSNTNEIHLRCFSQIIQDEHSCDLDEFFDTVYYSHYMNKRKPNADIFEQVLVEQGLNASETLFIDDNADNITGAANLGIQTLHITSAETLTDFFNE